MITALVLLKVERKKVNDIASRISEIAGVSEVYSVSGRYDLIALVRTQDNDALANVITGSMLQIDGILESETMLAFRAYSKHDLDSMFSIGTD